MKSLILKVTCMKKSNTLEIYVFYALLYVTVNETKNIDMSKVSITLNYHQFEVVTSEFLDFVGHKYEIIDFFSWCCAPGPQ